MLDVDVDIHVDSMRLVYHALECVRLKKNVFFFDNELYKMIARIVKVACASENRQSNLNYRQCETKPSRHYRHLESGHSAFKCMRQWCWMLKLKAWHDKNSICRWKRCAQVSVVNRNIHGNLLVRTHTFDLFITVQCDAIDCSKFFFFVLFYVVSLALVFANILRVLSVFCLSIPLRIGHHSLSITRQTDNTKFCSRRCCWWWWWYEPTNATEYVYIPSFFQL